MKLRMPEMPPATLLAALEGYNLLPAIVFLPTRRRCDQAASEAALTRRDPKETRDRETHERRSPRCDLCNGNGRCRRRLSRSHRCTDRRGRTHREWLASIICFPASTDD